MYSKMKWMYSHISQQFYQTLLCYKLVKRQPIGQSDLSRDFSRSEMFHIRLINSYRSTRTNMISVGRDQKNIGNGPISRSVADSAKCRVNVGFTTLLITAFFPFFNHIFLIFFSLKVVYYLNQNILALGINHPNS